METVSGPVLGALVYTGLYDTLLQSTPYWRAVLGAAIIGLVLAFPQGLAGRRTVRPARPIAASPTAGAPTAAARAARGGASLEARHLRKAFGGIEAVADLSVTLRPGEIVALIGPNGAGKSTCFNLLSGQVAPDAGRILLDGVDIGGQSAARLLHLGVARSFQVASVFASMTVRENVQTALLARERGIWRFLRRATACHGADADMLLASVGLAAQAGEAAAILAYGDVKRLELAITLAGAPRLLLMDEPTAGMAPAERGALMALVRRVTPGDRLYRAVHRTRHRRGVRHRRSHPRDASRTADCGRQFRGGARRSAGAGGLSGDRLTLSGSATRPSVRPTQNVRNQDAARLVRPGCSRPSGAGRQQPAVRGDGAAVHHRGGQLPGSQQPLDRRAQPDQRVLPRRRCSSAWCSRRSAGPTRRCRSPAAGWSTGCIRGCCIRCTIVLWSLATLTLGLSSGLVMLIVLRMAVGLFEVPSFLINNRIATTWFGERERATCIAVYTAAEYVGLAFLTPVLVWLKVSFGWPSVFFATGVLGLIWAVAFWRTYRDPADFPGVNAEEIRLIADSGGLPDLSQRIDRPPHRACRVGLARFRRGAGPAQAVGHLFRPFRLGHDLHVLPDLVPDLPGELPALHLHQGRLLRLRCRSWRCSGRAVFGADLRRAGAARLQPDLRAQGADHRRTG